MSKNTMPASERLLLARAMRRLRMERGLSLREVAVLFGRDVSRVSRAETGGRYPMSAELIAKAFGVTEEEVRRPCPQCDYTPPAGFTCDHCGTSGSGESKTAVAYVVEGRVARKPWLRLASGEAEADVRVAYGMWLESPGSLQVQMLKRTAVITDEVLESGQQGTPVPSTRVCIGCEAEEGQPHRDWCPVVTGRLGTLPEKGGDQPWAGPVSASSRRARPSRLA